MPTTKEHQSPATNDGQHGSTSASARTDCSTRVAKSLPIDQLVPDAANRFINEDSEEFAALVDSIRVLGVLSPLHVQEQGDACQIIDGERRWRASKKVGLAEVPCEVWPETANPRDALVAGVVLNEQRQAHSCIHVARRLREIKNTYGLTAEALSAQVGIPLDRVKTYSALFGASDLLLAFFEKSDVPLKVAAEMMRFEKATSEGKARQLVERYRQAPLGREEIVALRKRAAKRTSVNSSPALPVSRKPFLTARARAEFKRDPAVALGELQEFLCSFGYLLVEDASHVGTEV